MSMRKMKNEMNDPFADMDFRYLIIEVIHMCKSKNERNKLTIHTQIKIIHTDLRTDRTKKSLFFNISFFNHTYLLNMYSLYTQYVLCTLWCNQKCWNKIKKQGKCRIKEFASQDVVDDKYGEQEEVGVDGKLRSEGTWTAGNKQFFRHCQNSMTSYQWRTLD